MEALDYDSYFQWLPREVAEDVISIVTYCDAEIHDK